MNFAKKLLMVGGAIALAGIFGALLAPKAAHGIVATLVQVVNTSANPVPVKEQRTLAGGGQFFDVGPGGSVSLAVPAGTVLTDAHITFSVPESIPNAAALFVSDSSGVLVYQLVNNTTFHAGVDLGSGIMSTGGGISVDLSCYNITSNHCQGAIMWSGYTP
jgi:hypothetical protein